MNKGTCCFVSFAINPYLCNAIIDESYEETDFYVVWCNSDADKL